jgi:hypothetical protein
LLFARRRRDSYVAAELERRIANGECEAASCCVAPK